MNLLIGQAQADTVSPAIGGAGAPWPFFVTMVLVFVFMYFISIRPQQKRQKQLRQMLDALAQGDEVVFAGGLMGRVTRLNGDYAVIEVAGGTQLRVQRQSIVATLPKGTLKSIE